MLVLGPGSKITHDAIKLLASSGTSIVWSGSDQTRFYAFGRPLASNAKFVTAQAAIVSSPARRLKCARSMYQIRFPHDDFNLATIQKMRGREGARMKRIYKENAARTGVPWDYRTYQVGDIDESDIVNRCLTNGTQILYAVQLGIINALGLSPALGVIHMGVANSFVYDMADLSKSDIIIPIAFDVAATTDDAKTADALMRRRVRERMHDYGLLAKTVGWLYDLMLPEQENDIETLWYDDIALWAGADKAIYGTRNYSTDHYMEVEMATAAAAASSANDADEEVI